VGTRVGVHRVTCPAATGAVTVIAAVALFDASADDVAVMVAVPADTPVIVAVLPFGVTDTTAALDVDHETDCDAPFVTAAVAVSVAV
jgi:hypothetical protein